jgi:predicted N-acyltransferase
MSGSTLTVGVLDRTDRLDQAEWDELCADRPLAGYRWLRLAEAVLIDFNPRYLQLRCNGRLEAAAVCVIQRQFHLSAYLPSRFLQAIAGRFLARFSSLSCEIPFSFSPGLLVRPGCDPDRLIPPLLEAMEDLAARERAFFVKLSNLSSHDAARLVRYRPGYHVVSMLADTYLPISWPTFEDYQASRPAKKRRELRRVCRRAQEAGMAVEPHRLSPETEPRLRELVRNLIQRHDQKDWYVPDFFSRTRDVLGEDFSLLVARREGEIVACVALLRSKDELFPKWLGMSYEHTENTYTYHLFMAEIVARAIEMGVRRLWTGPTTYEVKKLLGTVFEARCLVLAARNRLFHRPIGWGLALWGKLMDSAAIADATEAEARTWKTIDKHGG